MKTDPLGTEPLFPPPEPAPVARPYNDVSGGYGPIRYTRLRPKKPTPCDDCMAAYRHEPNPPHSRPAAYKRTQGGTNPLHLCYEHVRIRKEAEAK